MWGLIPGGLPSSKVAGTTVDADGVVLDVDATIMSTHSEKERADRTFKKTFGFHPIGVWCDNTTELLACSLRPGNAGSNTTADHVEVLTAAIAQVPAGHRKKLLIRADGAGASHGLLDGLTALNTAPVHGWPGRWVEYSVGFALTEQVRDAITWVPRTAWSPALDADGEVRAHADVVEVTGLLPVRMRKAWPEQMRVIVRREHPHLAPSSASSKRPMGGATERSSPTPSTARSPSLKPGTAPTPASKTGSGSRKTPAWDGSRRLS